MNSFSKKWRDPWHGEQAEQEAAGHPKRSPLTLDYARFGTVHPGGAGCRRKVKLAERQCQSDEDGMVGFQRRQVRNRAASGRRLG